MLIAALTLYSDGFDLGILIWPIISTHYNVRCKIVMKFPSHKWRTHKTSQLRYAESPHFKFMDHKRFYLPTIKQITRILTTNGHQLAKW